VVPANPWRTGGEKTVRVLVTGGAGYIGSTLVPKLLKAGHEVRVLDSLLFGGESLLGVYPDPGFEFVRGDVRDSDALRAALDKVDAVIHLAALVGDPACGQDPEATRAINRQATCDLVDLSKEREVSRFILASTCSNYGISDTSVFADEEAPLNPVSLYAETKVAAEEYVVRASSDALCTTVLRLATVFGLSPRMRFDLLINEFVRDAVMDKQLLIYGSHSWRPFLHVHDAAKAFMMCLDAPDAAVRGQVFNVGGGNYRKIDLVGLLGKHIPDVKVEFAEGKRDPRDYKVSFEKIQRQLGFEATYDVEIGTVEIRDVLTNGVIRDPYSRTYRNVD
jgi:nucleoside-diphosphate-sugar epimerase